MIRRLAALLVVPVDDPQSPQAGSRRRADGFARAARRRARRALQATPGGLTDLSRRDVWITSIHVVCGALALPTELVLTLRSWRVEFAPAGRA
jgi:hypothetical protein